MTEQTNQQQNELDASPTVSEDAADTGLQEQGHQASRGEFLKWGTVALGGLYVGPKISSFAVEKSLGHAGSVSPSPSPRPSGPSQQEFFFPGTGGAAGLSPAERAELLKRTR